MFIDIFSLKKNNFVREICQFCTDYLIVTQCILFEKGGHFFLTEHFSRSIVVMNKQIFH